LRTAGLALFNSASCGACHAFADAGASGAIGPSLDHNPRLDKPFAIDVMTTGRGAMPPFAGQLSGAEIATLADYLVAFRQK
jgi:sulfite dehydrogenase